MHSINIASNSNSSSVSRSLSKELRNVSCKSADTASRAPCRGRRFAREACCCASLFLPVGAPPKLRQNFPLLRPASEVLVEVGHVDCTTELQQFDVQNAFDVSHHTILALLIAASSVFCPTTSRNILWSSGPLAGAGSWQQRS